MTTGAELRGTRCYVAWGVAERGPLFRLCSVPTGHELRAPAGPKPDVCRRTGTAEGVLSGCGRASGVSKCVSPSARVVAGGATKCRVPAGHPVHVPRARRRRAGVAQVSGGAWVARPLGQPGRRCVRSCGIRPDTALRGLRLRVAKDTRPYDDDSRVPFEASWLGPEFKILTGQRG